MLTSEQHGRREGKLGASFIPALMAGDEARLLREWMRLVGHPDYQPEDLSHAWPVIVGTVLEAPALDYWEWKTGHALEKRGQWVPHHTLNYLGCTLDAFREHDKTVIDVKCPGIYRKLDDVLTYYAGQLVVQRSCTEADRAALLVVHGGAEPIEYEVSWPPEYETEMWLRIAWFWARVESLQPPCAIPEVKAPLPVVRVVDMTGSNAWAENAGIWLRTHNAATAFNIAAKDIKSLVEPDVAKAYGHGIVVNRARGGALTIREGAR